MVEYREYIIREDGHFLKAIDLDCPDDERAQEKAKGLVDGHDVELWQFGRVIVRFKHTPE
jgi:hypothetical protein